MNVEIYGLVLAVVSVMVEALKPLPRWNRSYSGVLALGLGAVLGTLIGVELDYGQWTINALSGVAAGASAAGIVSAFKAAGEAARR